MARLVPVKKSDVRTARTPDGLRIDVRRRRPLWRVFGVVWVLFVMSLGVVDMLTGEPPEDSGGNWFIVFWIAIGCVLVGFMTWGAFHRERLVVGDRELTHVRWLGPLRRANAYDRAHVEAVRVDQQQRGAALDPRAGWRAYGYGAGTVAFDYGNRTIHVAEVEDVEAKRVVEALANEGLETVAG